MKTASDQAEVLLLELERRVGVDHECSEKVEAQLKVLLVQQTRVHAPTNLVARTAKILAVCLRGRGDETQAEQYDLMALNLERMRTGIRPHQSDASARSTVGEPIPTLPPRQVSVNGTGADQDSFGQSLRRLWKARRGSRFGAWGWVLKRQRF